LFSKNQLIPRIRSEFLNETRVNFVEYLREQGIPKDFGLDLLVQMALHKRCDLRTLVGILRHHFDHGQKTVDMIHKCAVADLVDWSPLLKIFIVKFTVPVEVQQELDRFQYPLPMVVEPREIKNNSQSGYYCNNSSVFLKDNHHEDDACLDHLNRMARMKFTLNTDTAIMVKNKWRNLDRPKDGETREDYMRRVRAFEKFDKTAKDVIDTLCKHGNEFYFTHRYDKRGRVYCQGHHVQYQGTPWCKAVVEFANKELTT
jgi:hypothetical protein